MCTGPNAPSKVLYYVSQLRGRLHQDCSRAKASHKPLVKTVEEAPLGLEDGGSVLPAGLQGSCLLTLDGS